MTKKQRHKVKPLKDNDIEVQNIKKEEVTDINNIGQTVESVIKKSRDL